MPGFRYADLHCHPNLKTFGHSFDRKQNGKSDVWHSIPPSGLTRLIHKLTGITKFTQTDFTCMTRAKAKIAFVSLYPFEKGFFINRKVTPPLAAYLADWGIEIGYERVRHIQKHTDYFKDLADEYAFFVNSKREKQADGRIYRWEIVNSWNEIEDTFRDDNAIAVILSIEGAHVFNTGLGEYGVTPDKNGVLAKIRSVKEWQYVPLFIGLAHNFNNDLCGHARSLQRLGNLVNQEKNINTGISSLGEAVIHALLDTSSGKRIHIDLKHMSLRSRLEYYELLQRDYAGERIPLIVSHGSVCGLSIQKQKRQTTCLDIFNNNDLNFFDEEIILLAKSDGIFAIQMDIGNNADLKKLRNIAPELPKGPPIALSALIIWNQLQYIAELLDSNGLFAWGSTSIGSDFDGSINPFPGILTASGFEPLSHELLRLCEAYLSRDTLKVPENRNISATEVINRFMYNNTENFLKNFFTL